MIALLGKNFVLPKVFCIHCSFRICKLNWTPYFFHFLPDFLKILKLKQYEMSSCGASSSSKSKCRTCGEKLMDTGYYQFKILRAKPIPLKIQKIIKAGKLDESKKDALMQTKFGRFLLKRADAGNSVVSKNYHNI